MESIFHRNEGTKSITSNARNASCCQQKFTLRNSQISDETTFLFRLWMRICPTSPGRVDRRWFIINRGKYCSRRSREKLELEFIALILLHLTCSVGINVLITGLLMQFYNTKIARALSNYVRNSQCIIRTRQREREREREDWPRKFVNTRVFSLERFSSLLFLFVRDRSSFRLTLEQKYKICSKEMKGGEKSAIQRRAQASIYIFY